MTHHIALAVLLFAASAQAQSDARPGWLIAAELGGPHYVGAGVAAESRVSPHIAVQGRIGSSFSEFTTLGASVALLSGGRRVEAEGGIGGMLYLDGDEVTAGPTAYGGVRFNLPFGSRADGTAVANDLVVRAGLTAIRPFSSSRFDSLVLFPGAGAGVSF